MLPMVIKPMLAAAAPGPFDSDDYLFEIKWDGIRCLAFVSDRTLRLQSRELLDITAQFPELDRLRQLPEETVLDGELIALENGRPSLSKIQGRVQLQGRNRIELLSQRSGVVFMVFDLLYLRGQSVTAEPLTKRRQLLREILGELNWPMVRMTEGVVGKGCDLFDRVKQLGLEGVMAKWLEGKYWTGKRSSAWKKIKQAGLRPNRFVAPTPLSEEP